MRRQQTSLHNRAQLYYEQGYYSSAEQMYLEALEIRRRVLQPEHLDIAQSLNNLAELYTVLGKFSQAESLYEEALSSQKNIAWFRTSSSSSNTE